MGTSQKMHPINRDNTAAEINLLIQASSEPGCLYRMNRLVSARICPKNPACRLKLGMGAGGANCGWCSADMCSQALARDSMRAEDSSIAAADRSSRVTKSTVQRKHNNYLNSFKHVK